MPASDSAIHTPKVRLDNLMLLMLATTAGITVANLYYIQPLLAAIAQSFHIAQTSISLAVTLTQAGYALGMLLILPLADVREKKSLILLMLGCSAGALLLVAFSRTGPTLCIASFLLGFTSVVPQLIVPFAAQLAEPEKRGGAIGQVMSGVLIGILLSRVFSGVIGEYLGWPAVYFIAFGLAILLGVFLVLRLPKSPSVSVMPYSALLRSMGSLARTLPLLREAALSGGLMFAAFSIFWTTLSFFLSGEPYHMGADAAGLFGLVGVTGALAAPITGRIADKKGSRLPITLSIGIVGLSYLCLLLFGRWMIGLVLGVILLDMGVQACQVSNFARVHAMGDDIRNRVNTVYMVTYFIGGAAGSYAGALSFEHFGWAGVCILGLLTQGAAIALHLHGYRRESRRAG